MSPLFEKKPYPWFPPLLAVFFLVVMGMAGCPYYRVWEQGLAGEAELKRASQNRQIAIQEADAKAASAKLLAQAEIERAKGVAEANRIIGESLQGHTEYLTYLWLQALDHSQSTIVYVPTEANLPLLEASRLRQQPEKK